MFRGVESNEVTYAIPCSDLSLFELVNVRQRRSLRGIAQHDTAPQQVILHQRHQLNHHHHQPNFTFSMARGVQ